ncbi:MAG: CoB--CoM heterodisulfide reductase iron-sulfur subunit B family protein [Thermodesulfobacteriota bacterium]|nr:CoB--CoM heterodisulfide reductase iron-sulfur subunit B family protein [Thermodesulfobacteriota bacterium]
MKYLYYPGCSLEASAMEYDVSTRAVMKHLKCELTEIEGWNCCGATAAEPVSGLLSFALGARNLALAEKMTKKSDILVPCSACYLNLKKVEIERKNDAGLSAKIDEVLAEEELELQGNLEVRHLLDVLANDIGADKIRKNLAKELTGLKIAPYYGCQALRPYKIFDDPEEPRSMEPLIRACGAEVFQWDMGAKCCGASNMNTKKESAEKLVQEILSDAEGADAIVTVCPMCQLNLEGFQQKISMNASKDLSISIIYLPQLLGLAMGLDKKEVMLEKNLAVKKEFKEKV